jgi:hypothetical protein
MVNLLIVSHSAQLAAGVKEFADQVTRGVRVRAKSEVTSTPGGAQRAPRRGENREARSSGLESVSSAGFKPASHASEGFSPQRG